jgi:hypothetical protein
MLDQRCLLHKGQLIIYWLSTYSTPYALEPSIDALTVSFMRAGYDSDDNMLPSVPPFANLCGSPIRKLILITIRKFHAVVEILLNGLAPWRSPTASTAPHSLDGVLLPAYILRCLFFPVCAACASKSLFENSILLLRYTQNDGTRQGVFTKWPLR